MVIFTTSVTTLGHDQRCAALCGAVRRCVGCVTGRQLKVVSFVAVKAKTPPLLWYKLSNIYQIFHRKYMVFVHE